VVYLSENQIKNELGINNWRNLLNDKIVQFTVLMPQINPAIMVSLVGQLPQLWHFANKTLRALESKPEIRQIPQQVRRLQDVRRFLDRDLDTDHNKTEDKRNFLEAILGVIDQQLGSDRLSDEDRKFITSIHELQGCDTRTMLIAVISFIGGRQWMAA
jgi:hypothetical protein